jgi:hypothetical protein
VQQAKRNAEQAESTARALQQQASAAQREAAHAQEGARSLQVQSDQAQSTAGQARQQVASLSAVQTVQDGFQTLRTQIAAGVKALDAAVPSVNAEGQTTGTLVNVAV